SFPTRRSSDLFFRLTCFCWPVRISALLGAAVLLSLAMGAQAQDDKDGKKPPDDKKPPEDKKVGDEKAFQMLLDKAEDEYKRFFNRPKNAREFWAAMKVEM